MLPYLDDADVVLLETTPLEQKRSKIVREALLNRLLGGPLTARQTNILAYEYGRDAEHLSYENIDMPSLRGSLVATEWGIVDRFHDSGKTIRLIDANPKDHPGIVGQVREALVVAMTANDAMRSDTPSSFAEIKGWQTDFFRLEGLSTAGRDEIAAAQVTAAQAEFPGKRLAVVYGALHSGISHEFLRRGDGARRIFLDPIPSPAGSTVYYGLDGEAIRRFRFGKPVTDELIMRTLLQSALVACMAHEKDIVLGSEVADLWKFEEATHRMRIMADRIARRATAEQLSTYAAVADEAFKDPRTETKQRVMEHLGGLVAASSAPLADKG